MDRRTGPPFRLVNPACLMPVAASDDVFRQKCHSGRSINLKPGDYPRCGMPTVERALATLLVGHQFTVWAEKPAFNEQHKFVNRSPVFHKDSRASRSFGLASTVAFRKCLSSERARVRRCRNRYRLLADARRLSEATALGLPERSEGSQCNEFLPRSGHRKRAPLSTPFALLTALR
jgi:hypothetical protein